MVLYLRRAVRGVNTNGAVVVCAAAVGVAAAAAAAAAGEGAIGQGHAIVGNR